MPSLGNSFVTTVLQAIWPRFCVACGVEGELLCKECSVTSWHEPPAAEADHIAFFAYANPTVRKLICAWKYDYDLSAFDALKNQARELLPEFKQGMQKLGVQGIVPLPLSARRLRERGFNQSRMIADWLAAELGVPVLEVLDRAHRRGHQAERTDEERQAAMTNSPFLLIKTKKLPEVVLLVDDVWTTGATMTAAKKVIESDQKTKVLGFTLAKG
jgi:competence protein ComFC